METKNKDHPILYAEVAETPADTAKGLMFRKTLPPSAGMLFKFKYPRQLRFWGENTYIPLDIAFIKENGEIDQIAKISPLSRKVVCSNGDCVMAIEANDGFFDSNIIKIGDTIEIEKDEIGGCCISFKKNKGK
jgi:hypothetical protein